MSECWQQAQVAEIARLQVEFDDARMRRGEALESTWQLAETLEGERDKLRSRCTEAVSPGFRPPADSAWCNATVCTAAPAYAAQMAPAAENWDSFFRGTAWRQLATNAIAACAVKAPTAAAAAAAGVGWDQYFGGRVSDHIPADLSSLCRSEDRAKQGEEALADKAEAEHRQRAPLDYTSTPETPSTDADVAALMGAAEKKKAMRAATKELYSKLDALLPPTRSALDLDADMLGGQAVKSRVVGRTGRSLIEILNDAVHCVKMHHGTARGWKPRKGRRGSGRRGKKDAGAAAHREPGFMESAALAPVHPCETRARVTAPHLEPGILQMSMLSSQSILCIEVSFPDCCFSSIGAGFLQLIQSRVRDQKNVFSTAQIGDLLSSMNLFHLVHPEDAEVPTFCIEEEDTCISYEEEDTCMSCEEEDTCVSYEEEDTCTSYEEDCRP